MTDAQRAEALRLVQAQAEQRIELSLKLLGAAKEQVAGYQQQVDELREQQQRFQDRVEGDLTASLRDVDQWMKQFDSHMTERMAKIDARLDLIEAGWSQAQEKIESFVLRAESLVEQSRQLMELSQTMRAQLLASQARADAARALAVPAVIASSASTDQVKSHAPAQTPGLSADTARVATAVAEPPPAAATRDDADDADAPEPAPPQPQVLRSQTSLIYTALMERLAARARAERTARRA